MVVGVGTGRCGTQTLAKLLDGCDYFHCTHERKPILPWEFDEKKYKEQLEAFKEGKSDVSLYHGRYISRYMDDLDDIKVIVLQREKKATVESFMAVTPDRNHWNDEVEQSWDLAFPSYDLPKKEAIEKYYDEYYELIPDDDRIIHIKTENLSLRKTQEKIFERVGIPKKDRVYQDIVANKRENHVGYRH